MRRILPALGAAMAIGLMSGHAAFADPYNITVAEGAGSNPSVATFTGTVSGGVSDGGTNPSIATNTSVTSWLAAETGKDVTITFSSAQDYIGLLWGSPDGNNYITFYDGNTEVAQYKAYTLSLAPYDLELGSAGEHSPSQPGGAYVSFTATSPADYFTKVVLSDSDGTPFESTNYKSIAAAPEPATWSMLMLGVGAIGFTMRRRKSLAAA